MLCCSDRTTCPIKYPLYFKSWYHIILIYETHKKTNMANGERKGGANEKNYHIGIVIRRNNWTCIRVPGVIIQRIGEKRRKKSKRCCKMYHRYRQSIQSNMFIAAICKMHGHRHKSTMQRMATMAWFTRPVKAIFWLARGGGGLLSGQRIALKANTGFKWGQCPHFHIFLLESGQDYW